MDKPHSTYLIMLAVGEFNIIDDKANEIPVQTYVDQNINLDEAKFSFRNTPEMVNIFSDKYLYKYPWSKYAQVVVEDFVHGGMENTTATVLNKRAIYNPAIENDYSADGLISHELGHMWWGDLITCSNWSEMWLNESFATYSTALWKEKYFGKDEYDYGILRNGDDALKADSTIGRYPIWAGYGSVTANIYDKGSVIINTFRYILGDKFFPSLYTFLKDNEYKNVVSKNLLEAINKTYNENIVNTERPIKDFKWMFDQWIWKAGYPKFEVKYDYNENAKEVILNVKQVQKLDTLTPLFRIPLDIRLKNFGVDKIQRIEIIDEDETFRIPFNSKPDFVEFDYGNNILDKTFFDKSFEDWKNQVVQSENAVDRIMALRGLERFLKGDESNTLGKPPITINQVEALKLFEDRLFNDKFYGVRIDAAKILGKNFILDRTSSILTKSYEAQTDSRIKREILQALGNSKNKNDAEFIINTIQNENNDYIIADGISALMKSLPKAEIYDNVFPYINRKAHRQVVQSAVIEALDSAGKTVKDERIKKAIMYIAFGIDVEGRLRAKAISALKKYAKDEDVKELAKKYSDFNFIFVKRALISLLAASEDKSLIQFFKNMNDKTTDEDLKKTFVTTIKKLEDLK